MCLPLVKLITDVYDHVILFLDTAHSSLLKNNNVQTSVKENQRHFRSHPLPAYIRGTQLRHFKKLINKKTASEKLRI